MANQDHTDGDTVEPVNVAPEPAPLRADGMSRRRFAGLGASGVIVTLASHPAMAQSIVCTSLSGGSMVHSGSTAMRKCDGVLPAHYQTAANWGGTGIDPNAMFSLYFSKLGLGSILSSYTLLQVVSSSFPAQIASTGSNNGNNANSRPNGNNGNNGNGNGNNGNGNGNNGNGNGNNGNGNGNGNNGNGNGNNGNGNNGNNGNGNGNGNNGNGNNGNGNNGNGNGNISSNNTAPANLSPEDVDKNQVAAHIIATWLNVRTNRVTFFTEKSVKDIWEEYASSLQYVPTAGAHPWNGAELVTHLKERMS